MEKLGEARLGVLELFLLDGLVEEVMPDCFDFLHTNYIVIR